MAIVLNGTGLSPETAAPSELYPLCFLTGLSILGGWRSISYRGPGPPCSVVWRDLGPQTQVHKKYLRKYLFPCVKPAVRPPLHSSTPAACEVSRVVLRSSQALGDPRFLPGRTRTFWRGQSRPSHRTVSPHAEQRARGQKKTRRREWQGHRHRGCHALQPPDSGCAASATSPRGGGLLSVCSRIISVLART